MLYYPGNRNLVNRGLALNAYRPSIRANEEMAHNVNSMMEAMTYTRVIAESDDNKMLVLSRSTAYGIQRLGLVGRVMDYIDNDAENSRIITNAQMMGIQGNSLIGFNICGGTSNTNCLRQARAAIFQPLSLYYQMLPQIQPVLSNAEFADVISKKFTFLMYTRTHLFSASNNGTTLIRPLFYQFPDDENTYSKTGDEFMYGPAFKVTTHYEKGKSDGSYFPTATWCGIAYFENPQCTQGSGKVETGDEWIQNYGVHMLEGNIAVLQDPKGILNTEQLKGVKADLHVFLKGSSPDDFSAHGELFLDHEKSKKSFAHILMDFKGDTLRFTTKVVDEFKTDETEKNNLGALYFYNPSKFPFK